MTGLLDERSCFNCKHDAYCNLEVDIWLYCFDQEKGQEIIAYLNNWWPQDVSYSKVVVWGSAYNSEYILDGCIIHSGQIEHQKLFEGQLIYTSDGQYRLGWKRK